MNNKKILIVEDEAIVALEIKYRLTKLGYIVTGTASSGKRALELAEETKPDVILMDIKLKGSMNGLETATQIRDRFGIPSIFLTAFTDDGTIKQMKEIFNYEHLQKPFEVSDLDNAIKTTLSKMK
jgi:CheY-like chemotaxis protein